MPALDFPNSPTNGQIFGNWVYSSSKQAWQSRPLTPAKTVNSPTAPSNPTAGDQWFNTDTGQLFIYYTDANTSQWVESRAPITADGYISPNYVNNAAFEINQRNFSSTTTAGVYMFDRWRSSTSGGTVTFSAQTFVPGAGPATTIEAANYIRIVTSGQTGTNPWSILEQAIEDVRPLAGKTVTLSFYARAAVANTSIASELVQIFGTGGSPSANVNTSGGRVVVGTSWQRYSMTVTLPSLAGRTFGTNPNTSALQIMLWVSGGSDYSARTNGLTIQNTTVELWGVQLEEGSVATPFRRNSNSIAAELAVCQRYYQTSYPPGVPLQGATNVTDGATFVCINTNDTGSGGALPVAMRTTPIFNVYSSNGGAAANSARVGASGANQTVSLNGGTAYNLPRLTASGTLLPAAGNVLSAHWVANAEF